MYYKRSQGKTPRIQTLSLNYEELFITNNNDLWDSSWFFNTWLFMFNITSHMWLFIFSMCPLEFITCHLLHKTNSIWDDGYNTKLIMGQILIKLINLFLPHGAHFIMYVCHTLTFVEKAFTQSRNSPTYHIFTSSSSINMVLELDCTLFHSLESFKWALTDVMEYYRIMSLVTSKPSCFVACLICSMYCLIS